MKSNLLTVLGVLAIGPALAAGIANAQRCVARERAPQMDPGLESAGWLETRSLKDVDDSPSAERLETLLRWCEELGTNDYCAIAEKLKTEYALFDDEVHPIGGELRTVKTAEGGVGRGVAVARFVRQSRPIYVVWFSGERQGDPLAYVGVDLSFVKKDTQEEWAWVDLMTGRICRLDDLTHVPVRFSPVVVAVNNQIPRRTVWEEMPPAEIVDALYRPWQGLFVGRNGKPRKMDVSKELWTKMRTKDFLPCFDKYGQFKWREWPGKTRSDQDLQDDVREEEADLAANPGRKDWNAFGGWAGGPQLKATGRFRVEKINGKWWLVDPEGRLFWSWGPVRVTPSSAMTPLNGNPRTPRVGGNLPDRDVLFEALPQKGDEFAQFYETHDALLKPFYLARNETRWYDFSAANLYRKYGKNWFEKYADICHRRLRSWGCNTIANSSDLRICLQDRTPYAERVECLSRPIAASWGIWSKFRDPFDPSFKEGCMKELVQHGREAHDPWCIGFFIDNEIQWGSKDTDLAQWTLWSPDDQPAKIEFTKRLLAKGIDPKRDKVPEAELRAFTHIIVEEYFRKTREAVKEFDPGLLYLGCRFAGAGRPWAIGACAKYADVVSYNVYHDDLWGWRLPGDLDAPVVIGEFHFGAHDRGLFVAAQINKVNQAGRAAAIKNYLESALANPQIVGVHWHQFSDQATSGRFDGEAMQVGWTDICDRPYKETVEVLRTIDLYGTRAGSDSSARCSDREEKESALSAEEADASVDFNAAGGRLERALHSAGLAPRIDPRARPGVEEAELKPLGLFGARTHDWARVNKGQRIVDTQFIFPLMHLDAKDPKNYFFKATDEALKLAQNMGLRIFYRLGSSIEHTEDGRHFNIVVRPEDYEKYAEVCAGIVRHYTQGWADGFTWDIPYWEIWNEPDNKHCWGADSKGWKDEANRKAFARFYAVVLKRLKGEFPSLKFGGPALVRIREEWFDEILSACAAEGVKPDFVSWHAYQNDADDLVAQPMRMRRYLDGRGLKGTGLVIDEWHYLGELGWKGMAMWATDEDRKLALTGSAGHNGIDSAAYTLYVLSKWQDTPLDQAYFYGCNREGNWGYLDENYQATKVYHALRLYGDAVNAERRVKAESFEPTVSILATEGNGRKRVLVTDYMGMGSSVTLSVQGVSPNAKVQVELLDWTHDATMYETVLVGGRIVLRKDHGGSTAWLVTLVGE